MDDILSQIIAYAPDRIDTELKARALVQGSRNMDQEPRNMYNQGQLVQNTIDGSRPGYAGDETFLVKIGNPKKLKNVIEQEFIEVTGSKNRPETYKKTGVKKTLYKPQIVVGNKTVLTTDFGSKDDATAAVEKYRKTTPIKNAPPDLNTLNEKKKKKYLDKRKRSAKIIAGGGVEDFATGDNVIHKGHAQNINNPDVPIKPSNIIYTPEKINRSMAGQGSKISPTDLDYKIDEAENKIKDIKKSNMSGAKKKVELEKLDTKLMKYVADSNGYKTVTLSGGNTYGQTFQKNKSMDMFDEFPNMTEKETKKFVNQYFNDEGKLKDKWTKGNVSSVDKANIQKSYVFLENIENAKANAKQTASLLEKLGCGKSAGGRIKFNKGTTCAIKGREVLEKGLKNGFKKSDVGLAQKILGTGKFLKDAVSLRGLLGPAALAFTAAAEAGLVGYDMLTSGKSFKEAVGSSVFNYMLGDKTKIDEVEERDKRMVAEGMTPEQMGKIKYFESMMGDMQQGFDLDNQLNAITKNRKQIGNNPEDTFSEGAFQLDLDKQENKVRADIQDYNRVNKVGGLENYFTTKEDGTMPFAQGASTLAEGLRRNELAQLQSVDNPLQSRKGDEKRSARIRELILQNPDVRNYMGSYPSNYGFMKGGIASLNVKK
jgi:hypothetical protein